MTKDFCDICETEIPRTGSGGEFKFVTANYMNPAKPKELKIYLLCDSCVKYMRDALAKLSSEVK